MIKESATSRSSKLWKTSREKHIAKMCLRPLKMCVLSAAVCSPEGFKNYRDIRYRLMSRELPTQTSWKIDYLFKQVRFKAD